MWVVGEMEVIVIMFSVLRIFVKGFRVNEVVIFLLRLVLCIFCIDVI